MINNWARHIATPPMVQDVAAVYGEARMVHSARTLTEQDRTTQTVSLLGIFDERVLIGVVIVCGM